ncbi:hypothetical protein HY991_05265 [Candidatus Micrarchaeota archaeon]|nr:hypothetical protein [Candidatus Micrarchaeota archaeon]
MESVFFAVLPDIAFGIPVIYYLLRFGRKTSYEKIFSKIEPFYRGGHSLLVAFSCFAITSLFIGSPYLPLLAGWGLHSLLDIPLHKGGWVQGQAVFYPISHKRISGRWWWKEAVETKPWIAFANYSLAMLVYFLA